MIDPVRRNGANLINKNSKPCNRVPTIANSGSLKSQVKYSPFIAAKAIKIIVIIAHNEISKGSVK